LKIVLGKHIHLGLHPLQQLVLHHRLRKLILPLRHLIHALLLPKWRFYLLRLQLAPVHIAQPRVRLDLLHPPFRPQSRRRGTDNQLVHEISSLYAPVFRNLLLFDHVLLGEDGISDLYAVVATIGTLDRETNTLESISSYAIMPIA